MVDILKAHIFAGGNFQIANQFWPMYIFAINQNKKGQGLNFWEGYISWNVLRTLKSIFLPIYRVRLTNKGISNKTNTYDWHSV